MFQIREQHCIELPAHRFCRHRQAIGRARTFCEQRLQTAVPRIPTMPCGFHSNLYFFCYILLHEPAGTYCRGFSVCARSLVDDEQCRSL